MKNLLSFAALACWLGTASAQSVTTFNLDMSCEPDFEHVFVTGPWCGWCGSDESNILTDEDGDGVYTISITNLTGTVEYKYAIDDWGGQENLVNDMQDGADCAPITDYNAYANRTVLAGGNTNDFYGTCDGVCNDVPPTEVTFHVDMAGYGGDQDPTQPTWNSEANGWCGNCAPMTDEDGDGVYSLTVPLNGAPGDTVEYKFAIGAWLDQEDIEPESSCTLTTYSDDAPNGCCYVNRFVVLNGETIDADVVCWNLCGSCTTPGCTNEEACNFDAMADTDDGSCLIVGEACDDGDDMTTNEIVTADCACVGEPVVMGCMDAAACNFNGEANVEDDSCAYPGDDCDDEDEGTINDMYDDDCGCAGEDIVMGCTDETACNFDAAIGANVDDGSCLQFDALNVCGGDCFSDQDGDGICDGLIVYGCIDTLACNYDTLANTLDDSCIFPGYLELAVEVEDANCFGEMGLVTLDSATVALSEEGVSFAIDTAEVVFGGYALPSGAHVLTATDSIGCPTDLDFEIGQPDSLSVDSAYVTNGTSGAVVSGGTAPYLLEWTSEGGVVNPSELEVGSYELTVTATDSLGCTAELTITADILANVADLVQLQGSVFPVPVVDQLHVRLNQPLAAAAQIEVRDLQGRLMTSVVMKAYELEIVLDAQHWSSGMYVLQLASSQGRGTWNFVK